MKKQKTNLDRTFVMSDPHLGHQNVLKHDKRPWTTIQEHDEAHITNILDVVPERGTLWLLGDVGRRPGDVENLLLRLKRKQLVVNLVRGNHDDDIRDDGTYKGGSLRFNLVRDVVYFKMEGHKFFLSHYPHISWRGSHRGSFHLHGHVHGALGHVADNVRRMDVGSNVIGYKPISLAEVVDTLSCKEFKLHH